MAYKIKKYEIIITEKFYIKRKTHQLELAQFSVGYQTHYLIIAKKNQRNDVRECDRQSDNFKNLHFCLPAVFSPHLLRWYSHRSSRWCVDILSSVITKLVACLIVFGSCFALKVGKTCIRLYYTLIFFFIAEVTDDHNEELVLNTIATINNLSYYTTKSSAVLAQIIHIVKGNP